MKCRPLSLYKNDLLRAISEVVDSPALISVTNALNCWLRSMTRNIIVELVLAMQLVVVPAAPPTNRVTLHVHTGFGWKTVLDKSSHSKQTLSPTILTKEPSNTTSPASALAVKCSDNIAPGAIKMYKTEY